MSDSDDDFQKLRAVSDFYARTETSKPRNEVQTPLISDSFKDEDKYPLDELCWGETRPEKIIKSGTINCPIKSCREFKRDRDVPQYMSDGTLKGITRSGCLGDYKPAMPYAAVCECQSCHNKFWFHIDKRIALLFQPHE